tara:strand:- start:178 stop:630 length:453 start_codon:yes stop_codon:yes gene_type:complete
MSGINNDPKAYDTDMLKVYDTDGLLPKAETIIQQSKGGNITKDTKTTLDTSLLILANIYIAVAREVYGMESTPGQMRPHEPLTEKNAKHIIFLKNMELQYLSKWINVKRFLTDITVVDGEGHNLKGGKCRKSRKGRQGRKGRKSRKSRKV